MLVHGRKLRTVLAACSMLSGLYLPACANTNVPVASPPAAAPTATPPAATQPGTQFQGSGVEIGAVDLSSTTKTFSVALLLPLRSEALHQASDVLRAGFLAAHERDRDGITINVIETGDTAQDILSGYKTAAVLNDIVVGPLSRTGVTAVVQEGAVDKPTIALTSPETTDTVGHMPANLVVVGLSIEDEARQVADWADKNSRAGKALVLLTKSAWQRRAATAFETQWRHRGMEAESIEILANDGFLNGRTLLQLKKQIETEKPVAVFLALDARQARQVRAIIGKAAPLYGTSQLNPFVRTDQAETEHAEDMDGVRLLDIPWQLQPDHPAVMVYPRLVANGEERHSADLERLYALGIDAYRVAHEIAAGRTQFEIDGVTGKLAVRFGRGSAHFERLAQPAVYREGTVVPVESAH